MPKAATRRGVKRNGRKMLGEPDLESAPAAAPTPACSSQMTLLRRELDKQRIPDAALDKIAKDELNELGICTGALDSSDEEIEHPSAVTSSRAALPLDPRSKLTPVHDEESSPAEEECAKMADAIAHVLVEGGELLREMEAESAQKPKLTITLNSLNVHHLCRCSPVSRMTSLDELRRLGRCKLNELETAFLCSRHLPLRNALLRRFRSLPNAGHRISMTFYEATSILQFVCENRDASLLVRQGDNAIFEAVELLPEADHGASQKARIRNCLRNIEDFLPILSAVDYSSWKHKQLTKLLIALCRIYVDHDSAPLREPISLTIENVVKSLNADKAKKMTAMLASRFDEIDPEPLAALRAMTMLSWHDSFIHHRLKAVLRVFQKFLATGAAEDGTAVPKTKSKHCEQSNTSTISALQQLKVNNVDLKSVVDVVPQLAKHLMTRRSALYVLFQLLDLGVTTKAIASETSTTLSAYIEILRKAELYLKSNDIDGAVISSVNNARHRMTLVKNRGYDLEEWSSDDTRGEDGEDDSD